MLGAGSSFRTKPITSSTATSIATTTEERGQKGVRAVSRPSAPGTSQCHSDQPPLELETRSASRRRLGAQVTIDGADDPDVDSPAEGPPTRREARQRVANLCRTHGITEQTWSRFQSPEEKCNVEVTSGFLRQEK